MRILSVTQSYWPFLEFGGPPVKVRALAQGLARRGHQVTVLTADWGFEKRAAAEQVKGAELSPFGWRHTENGVTAVYLPTWLSYRATSWNPAAKRFCRAKLADFDIAHIYGLYDFLGPTVAAACAARNIPYVLEPIGMYIPIVRNFLLKRTYHALYGNRMFESAAMTIATSEQEVHELTAGGIPASRIRLRRNGVQAPLAWPKRGEFRGRLGIAENAPLVLFLGRLSEKKSPDLLLEAFAQLDGQERDWHLVFAGPDEGGMKARLERRARTLNLNSRVKFSGPLYGDDKWAAYRDASVFVLPSQNENFGNTAAEAVAAGTPVVVTEQCGIAPVLADVAGLVVRHDAEELAAGMKKVVGDDELRARLLEGCRKVSARLSWEEPVGQMELLYNELAIARAGKAES
jgi:glycosyltransferase involved in cell wall biosynthesis